MRAEEIFLVRFVLAYACIWTISPHQLWCNNWKDEALMVLLGITGGSLYFLSENIAVGISYVNNVSFIVCTAPLWTTLLGLMFLKDVRASRYLFAGSLMAVLGMGMVIFNGHFILRLNPAGDLLALAAALCWAVYSVLIKFVSGRYSAVFITRKVFIYGLLSMMPYFFVYPGLNTQLLIGQPGMLWNLLFLGCAASTLCFLAWNWTMKKLGAVIVTNYVYFNPVTTILFAWLILSEPITVHFLLGTMLILIGMYLSDKPNK
jgi:drug/metabolite transporter (DMT)-like permease